MKYVLRIPDLAYHDDRTCGGAPHCKVGDKLETYELAYPLWRTCETEIDTVRMVRQRFPDAFPVPLVLRAVGEERVSMVLFASEEVVSSPGPKNPVCIVELQPETREDRKSVRKRSSCFTKALWFEGWIPELQSVAFERELAARSSLRVGPTTLPVQVGRNRDGQWEIQIPGAFAITMTDEFVEQLAKLKG